MLAGLEPMTKPPTHIILEKHAFGAEIGAFGGMFDPAMAPMAAHRLAHPTLHTVGIGGGKMGATVTRGRSVGLR